MENLWTPWRFHYISASNPPDGCVFCRILDSGPDKDPENLIVHRGKHCFVILNRFPYTSGHLMVVACRHISSLSEADPEELHELMLMARRCEKALKGIYNPEGFNIGINLGKCAGAGVESHLHLHVIPRWTGDSNFVAVSGQTRIIPELLEDTFNKVSKCFKNT